MRRSAFGIYGDNDGAVAPTLAISLFALIAAGGLAFDYARMASMDTELQSAADQAALAAASQLDGGAGACARAAAAAQNMLTNRTYMANDSAGTAVTIPSEPTCDASGLVRFYKDIGKTTAATSDADAKFVEVQVDPRQSYYALTPIVGAISSGQMTAIAFAGLDSAICKVPPLMLCNPNEGSDPDFTIANYVGKGIRLVANDGGGIYGPGNFGFLDVGAGNGAASLRNELGRAALAADCVRGTGVDTEPGNMISVRDALNTRFDIYDNGLTQACGNNGALCPPSINTRKDLVQKGNGCGFQQNGNGNGWREPDNDYPNRPIEASHALTDAQVATLAPAGYPRDICHAFSPTGDCSGGRIGSGTWDRFAYFKSRSTNSGGSGPTAEYPQLQPMTTASTTAFNSFLTTNFGTTTPTRYQVYQWEMNNLAARLKTNVTAGLVGSLASSSQPVCAPVGSGITPSATQIDRRVLSVAVVNCTAQGVRGHSTGVAVTKWLDIFLTEPSVARTRTVTRTDNSDVYIEVIGQTQNATDEGAVQLVKKSVPYLIE